MTDNDDNRHRDGKITLESNHLQIFLRFAGADPGFSERGGCTDVGDLEGAARPLPTRGVWGHAPPENF